VRLYVADRCSRIQPDPSVWTVQVKVPLPPNENGRQRELAAVEGKVAGP
jgi:hypothetical protein